jgi:hypothetical protein
MLQLRTEEIPDDRDQAPLDRLLQSMMTVILQGL